MITHGSYFFRRLRVRARNIHAYQSRITSNSKNDFIQLFGHANDAELTFLFFRKCIVSKSSTSEKKAQESSKAQRPMANREGLGDNIFFHCYSYSKRSSGKAAAGIIKSCN